MYMQMYNQLSTERHMKKWIDQINMEWKDYDDFEKKYGSDVDPDNFARRYSNMYIYDGIGYLLKENQIDVDTAYQLGAIVFVWHWKKYEPIMTEHRRRYNHHTTENLEYLAYELIKYGERIGKPIIIPDTWAKYIPDKPNISS